MLDFLCSTKVLSEIVVSGGGEPLLHPDIGLVLSRLAAISDIERRLYTNGALLQKHFSALQGAFDYIRISIDAGGSKSYAKLHGTAESEYERILDSAANLVVAGKGRLHVALSFVVTDENCGEFESLVLDAAARGIEDVLIKPLISSCNASYPNAFNVISLPFPNLRMRNVAYTHPTPEAMPINVAAMNLLSNADGYFYPCCHSLSNDRRISPVLLDRLKETWNTQDHRAVLTKYIMNSHPCRAHSAWNAATDFNRNKLLNTSLSSGI